MSPLGKRRFVILLNGLISIGSVGCQTMSTKMAKEPPQQVASSAQSIPNGMAKTDFHGEISKDQQFNVHMELARVHEAQNNYDAALAEYQQAIDIGEKRASILPGGRLSPENLALAHRRMAANYDRMGRFVLAEAQYNKALKLAPNDPKIWNDAGYSYYLQNRLEDSEKALKTAQALDPNNPRIQTNLGLTLAVAGKTDQALTSLVKAGGPAVGHANLGFIMAASGKSDIARKEYEAALALQPELASARSALTRLDQLSQNTAIAGQQAPGSAAELVDKNVATASVPTPDGSTAPTKPLADAPSDTPTTPLLQNAPVNVEAELASGRASIPTTPQGSSQEAAAVAAQPSTLVPVEPSAQAVPPATTNSLPATAPAQPSTIDPGQAVPSTDSATAVPSAQTEAAPAQPANGSPAGMPGVQPVAASPQSSLLMAVPAAVAGDPKPMEAGVVPPSAAVATQAMPSEQSATPIAAPGSSPSGMPSQAAAVASPQGSGAAGQSILLTHPGEPGSQSLVNDPSMSQAPAAAPASRPVASEQSSLPDVVDPFPPGMYNIVPQKPDPQPSGVVYGTATPPKSLPGVGGQGGQAPLASPQVDPRAAAPAGPASLATPQAAPMSQVAPMGVDPATAPLASEQASAKALDPPLGTEVQLPPEPPLAAEQTAAAAAPAAALNPGARMPSATPQVASPGASTGMVSPYAAQGVGNPAAAPVPTKSPLGGQTSGIPGASAPRRQLVLPSKTTPRGTTPGWSVPRNYQQTTGATAPAAPAAAAPKKSTPQGLPSNMLPPTPW